MYEEELLFHKPGLYYRIIAVKLKYIYAWTKMQYRNRFIRVIYFFVHHYFPHCVYNFYPVICFCPGNYIWSRNRIGHYANDLPFIKIYFCNITIADVAVFIFNFQPVKIKAGNTGDEFMTACSCFLTKKNFREWRLFMNPIVAGTEKPGF